MTTTQSPTDSENLQSKKGFLIDSFKLGFGTASGQLVIVLSTPILSRIFPPETFGLAYLFLSIVLITSRVSGFRYEVALMLPAKQNDAKSLFMLATGLALIVSLVLGVVFVLFQTSIAGWLNSPSLAGYFYLLGPAIFLFSMVNALNFWNSRKKQFNRLAFGRLSNNLGSVLFQLGGGLLGFINPFILIAGIILGKFVEFTVISFREIKEIFNSLPKNMLLKTRALARKYKKFPKFNTWAVLINNLSWYVPGFILAGFFSTTIVGWYMMGERAIRAPMNFIGHAISQVFFQRGSEANRNKNLDVLFKDTAGMLMRIGSLPSLVILLLGKDIFSILLGPNWAEAGVYVQILSPWALIWFITSPVSPIISITNNLEKGLVFDAVSLTLRILSLIVGGLMNNPRIAIMLFCISGIIAYGWLLLWVGTFAGVSVSQTLRLFIHKNQLWLPGYALFIFTLKYFHIPPLILIVFSAMVLAIYFVLLVRKNKRIFKPQQNLS